MTLALVELLFERFSLSLLSPIGSSRLPGGILPSEAFSEAEVLFLRVTLGAVVASKVPLFLDCAKTRPLV